MMEKERSKDITCTIKGTVYDIDEVYFEHIMRQLGEFLCERYKHVDVVSPLEVMSQIAYIDDLTIHAKMYMAFWIGKHSENLEYEGYILACMNND